MRNLAFLSSQQKSILADFADASAILGRSRIHLLLPDARAIALAEKSWPRLDPSLEIVGRDFASMGFHRVPISFGDIHRRLLEWLRESGSEPLARTLLVVDMSWGLDTNSAAANFGGWLGVVDALTELLPIAVVSLYNRRLLIDEQLLTALRGHQGFLTSYGLVANPHWLPAHLLTRVWRGPRRAETTGAAYRHGRRCALSGVATRGIHDRSNPDRRRRPAVHLARHGDRGVMGSIRSFRWSREPLLTSFAMIFR